MDELLNACYTVCIKLLPILGCVVLLFLIFFIRRLTSLLNELSGTIGKVNHTIDTVDKSLDQLQGPLTTLTSIAHTVDTVHAYGNKIVKEAFLYLAENIGALRDWVSSLLHKKHTPETDDASTEEMIAKEQEDDTTE